jgi:multidrug resistance efflux pump
MLERGRGYRGRTLAVAVVGALVLVGGYGAVAYATSQNTTPTYVTAIAGQHSVLQSLQATGTTEPSSAATVSFAVSGTVATVPVTMGQKVTAGQVLATLDTTSLEYALATAQGQVANAELTLSQAESGQVSAATTTGSTTGATSNQTPTAATGTSGAGASGTAGSAGTTSSKTGTTGTGSAGASTTATKSPGASHTGSGAAASITAAQRLLLATVHQADSLLARTKTDLASATTLCSSQNNPLPTPTPTSTPTPTPTSTPTPTQTSTPTPAATPSPTLTPAPAPTAGKTATTPAALTISLATMQNVSLTTTAGGRPATCIQGQQVVLKDESRLLTLQQGLSGQEAALDKLLTSSASSTGTSSTSPTSTGTSSAGRSPTGRSPTGTSPTGTSPTGTSPTGTTSAGKTSATTGGTGSTTVAVSAAQLAADQAAVDAANASLALAQQQLSQASIVSPLTGVVSSVGLTVGQQATAGSTTTAVDVIDPTGHGVTLSVDVTKIAQVKVGDKATVVPDGSSTPLAATVSYVAAAPTTSSSTAYNVQLAFTSTPTKLRDGVQAAVTITTAQAVNALAVPTSSVNHLGTIDYVLVLNGSTTKMQIITVGSVGALYTQVTGGLTAGQRVVLANPNTPIPTSTVTGRIARITGGASGTTGLLGGTSGTSGTRPSG